MPIHFKKVVSILVIGVFMSFSPNLLVWAADEEQSEESKKPEEQSCATEIMEENKEKGVEMTEKQLSKAIKKCEKKRERRNKPKCQPTGSRLSRC